MVGYRGPTPDDELPTKFWPAKSWSTSLRTSQPHHLAVSSSLVLAARAACTGSKPIWSPRRYMVVWFHKLKTGFKGLDARQEGDWRKLARRRHILRDLTPDKLAGSKWRQPNNALHA